VNVIWFCRDCDEIFFSSFGTRDGFKQIKNPKLTDALIANELTQMPKETEYSESYDGKTFTLEEAFKAKPKRREELRFAPRSSMLPISADGINHQTGKTVDLEPEERPLSVFDKVMQELSTSNGA
jgi:hypothetical protein